jgi:hypothetical protein
VRSDTRKVGAQKGWVRFTSILERSDNNLWGCHFRVPEHIAGRLIDGGSRRVVCMLNGSVERQCAILPRGKGLFVITVNRQLRDKLGLSFGMEVRVDLRRDSSEYGLPLPDELRELLRQDKEGNVLFNALTRGGQRTLLYIVGSAKSSEKRAARAVTVVNHLKANGGKINYKHLNTSLKDPRR